MEWWGYWEEAADVMGITMRPVRFVVNDHKLFTAD